MNQGFTESVVEEAAFARFAGVGWLVRNGAAIAPGEPVADGSIGGAV